MITALLLSLLLGGITYLLIKQYLRYNKIKHIPGPTSLPFIGNALELGTNNEEFLNNLERLTKKYGNIVRLCIGFQNGILLADPRHIGQVLIAADHYHKGDFYKILKPLLGNSVVTISGERWVKHRRILNTAFSKKQMNQYVSIFNRQGIKLVDQIKKRVDDVPADISDLVYTHTFNVVCNAVMELDIDDHPEYHILVGKLLGLCMKRFTSPLRRIELLYRFTDDYRKTQECASGIDQIVGGIIKTCKKAFMEKGGESSSILGQLVRMSKEDLLTDENLRDEINSFVSAGSDSTATTLNFVLYELAKHPIIQEKALKEIEDVLGSNIKDDIDYQLLQDLKYLECILKEAMRLYTPVPLVTRILPNEIRLGDYIVPAETTVMLFPFGVHRSPTIFPEPEKFDPERFLPQNWGDRNVYSFIPFAAGPRVCIGQKFAMLEMKVTLVKILRNFILNEYPGHRPVLSLTGTLKSANALPVLLKMRPRRREDY